MSHRKTSRQREPLPAFFLAFHDAGGRPCGGAVDGTGPDLCGPVGGRVLHIVRIPTGQRGDGLRCRCGVFVRRVLPECPTCHRGEYILAEPVPGLLASAERGTMSLGLAYLLATGGVALVLTPVVGLVGALALALLWAGGVAVLSRWLRS